MILFVTYHIIQIIIMHTQVQCCWSNMIITFITYNFFEFWFRLGFLESALFKYFKRVGSAPQNFSTGYVMCETFPLRNIPRLQQILPTRQLNHRLYCNLWLNLCINHYSCEILVAKWLLRQQYQHSLITPSLQLISALKRSGLWD